MASDTVVWAGLDYSLVRMIGPGDFRRPDAIFPGMLEAWNSLFLRERVRKASAALKKRFVPDIGGVTERNKTATAGQITEAQGPDDTVQKSHLSAQNIADAVKAYKLESKSGLGLVFIVDRLVKPQKKGAVYVVFFDVATREVIVTDRQIHPASGGGFRNYWFSVVKRTDARLGTYR
jgi:hypothetical protein